MQRFKFKLARLLRVRELREELARGELVAAEHALRSAELALEHARADLCDARSELALLQTRAAIAPGTVLAAQRTVPGLERRIGERRERAQGLALAAAAARDVWQAARVDVRALRELELRARADFDGERRAAEDKVSAELVDRKAALAARAPAPEVLER